MRRGGISVFCCWVTQKKKKKWRAFPVSSHHFYGPCNLLLGKIEGFIFTPYNQQIVFSHSLTHISPDNSNMVISDYHLSFRDQNLEVLHRHNHNIRL